MRVTMIGTGYVGLVSGACFADFGNQVVCVDKDNAKIDQLARGECPIFEPFLDALIARNIQAGRLSFATESGPAIPAADAVFIAVGTPSRRGDGFADLTFVYDAAREIAAELDGFTVIATKSTVPVGTGDEVGANVQEVARGMGLDGRIGSKFLHAGPGFGGSCFPKDASTLVAIGQRYGAPTRIVETVISVNGARKSAMVQKIVAACGGTVRGKRLAVLGLAFQPNTDDMREAPSPYILPVLVGEGAGVRAHDPSSIAGTRTPLPAG